MEWKDILPLVQSLTPTLVCWKDGGSTRSQQTLRLHGLRDKGRHPRHPAKLESDKDAEVHNQTVHVESEVSRRGMCTLQGVLQRYHRRTIAVLPPPSNPNTPPFWAQKGKVPLDIQFCMQNFGSSNHRDSQGNTWNNRER